MTLPVRKIQEVEKYAREKYNDVAAMLERVGPFDELKRLGLIDDIPSSHSQMTGDAEPEPGTGELHEISGPTIPVDERQVELKCPPELVPFLDQRFMVKDFAYMVHRETKSIKTRHKTKWGPPEIPNAGTKGAEWLLRKALPGLLEDFSNIRPPVNPSRADTE